MMNNETWRKHLDSAARGIGRESSLDPREAEPTTTIDHTPSLLPTAAPVPPSSSGGSFPMASFGIGEDPDVEARAKRGKIFAASLAVLIAIAAVFVARSPAPHAAKPKDDKPPAAAAAAPPPATTPSASAAPAPSAAPSATPAPSASTEKAKEEAPPKAKRRHKKK